MEFPVLVVELSTVCKENGRPFLPRPVWFAVFVILLRTHIIDNCRPILPRPVESAVIVSILTGIHGAPSRGKHRFRVAVPLSTAGPLSHRT
jgi:hypothetical protein